MSSPEEELCTLLEGMGIASQSAAPYATALVQDGFDTPAAFHDLSLDELKEDFEFKRGHLRMVEKSRAGAAPAAARAAALPMVAEPEPMPEGMPPGPPLLQMAPPPGQSGAAA